jgi:VanZ family protein
LRTADPYFNLKRLTIAILFAAIVVFVTHIPPDVMPKRLQASGLDKIEHVVAYGAITILFVLSLRVRFSLLSAVVLFLAISVVGAFDELTQPFFNRIASPMDWAADLSGIITTLLVFLFLQSRRNRVATGVD